MLGCGILHYGFTFRSKIDGRRVVCGRKRAGVYMEARRQFRKRSRLHEHSGESRGITDKLMVRSHTIRFR